MTRRVTARSKPPARVASKGTRDGAGVVSTRIFRQRLLLALLGIVLSSGIATSRADPGAEDTEELGKTVGRAAAFQSQLALKAQQAEQELHSFGNPKSDGSSPFVDQEASENDASDAYVPQWQPAEVESGPLREEIRRESMGRVALDYLYWGSLGGPGAIRLKCKGDPCPAFTRCPGVEQGPVHIEACWNDDLVDFNTTFHPPPRNCPKLTNQEHWGPKGRDEACSHVQDYTWHAPRAYQTYRLQNVYVDGRGVVFNSTFYFDADGCNRWPEKDYDVGDVTVHSVKRGFNLVYRHSHAFYHGLVEWMPHFLHLAPFFRMHPDIPILFNTHQPGHYRSLVEPILGVPLSSLNQVVVPSTDFYFVEELYQPMYQECGNPSPAVWGPLRSQVLLPPTGIPAFYEVREPWRRRNVALPAETDGSRVVAPHDWVVVLLKREGTTRSIVQIRDIEEVVRSMFPPGRVVVHSGSPSLLMAQAIFKRAILLVGAHGAGLTNMIFMPKHASVIEIRPREYKNACYNSLSFVCSLKYYLLLAEGDKDTQVDVDIQSFAALLRQVKRSLKISLSSLL